MEPSVSVPMAMGAIPAATATALPEEEPPGVLENVSSDLFVLYVYGKESIEIKPTL
jgi:hypothetical protein